MAAASSSKRVLCLHAWLRWSQIPRLVRLGEVPVRYVRCDPENCVSLVILQVLQSGLDTISNMNSRDWARKCGFSGASTKKQPPATENRKR